MASDVGGLGYVATPKIRREKWSTAKATHQQNGQRCSREKGSQVVHIPDPMGTAVRSTCQTCPGRFAVTTRGSSARGASIGWSGAGDGILSRVDNLEQGLLHALRPSLGEWNRQPASRRCRCRIAKLSCHQGLHGLEERLPQASILCRRDGENEGLGCRGNERKRASRRNGNNVSCRPAHVAAPTSQ